MAAQFTPNREELAWAAGFFDGEGHVSSRERRGKNPANIHRRIQLIVGQRHREPLERFRSAVNGQGNIYEGLKDGRPFFQFSTGRYETVQAIVAMIWPFLCSVKQAQAAKALMEIRDYKRSK